jgi:hypothetical protein
MSDADAVNPGAESTLPCGKREGRAVEGEETPVSLPRPSP